MNTRIFPLSAYCNSGCSSLELTLKEYLSERNADIIAQFQSGILASTLIRLRSDCIDNVLRTAWQNILGTYATEIALVAVGGYGRRELHPGSDIDILILLSDPDPGDELVAPPCQHVLSTFQNLLWDIGLKPAQSVRTLEDCVILAKRDQTVITNLIESRLIAGSQKLFESLWAGIGPEHLWPPSEFFEAKIGERDTRYVKYHDTAYNLEPNVKEGPGGLRDIQSIAWIIKRQYNRQTLDLLREGWLTSAEYAELIESRDFLWQIRFALHIVTGRAEDRLLFEHQYTLARQFGYGDEDVNAAVEQFMQRYYRTVMGLERLNEMLMQLFKEVVLRAHDTFSISPISEHFRAVNYYVEVLHQDVFKQHPLAILKIFVLLQQNKKLKGIRASTIRLIREHLYLIDEQFRLDPEACRLFMTLLRQKNGITQQLRRMNRYGVLAAYLPAFGSVVGRMQYDLFHVYTVDEHTLFVIRNLRRFSLEKFRHTYPLCHELFELIEKPELLYIAALMHDIAKGSGEDHSVAGAAIADDFCRHHSISPRDTALVRWLVKNHLLMSMTAQRKDIYDPEVIHEFATAVGDQNTLNYLYLLTVADICATNPNLWNGWKDSLLKELYVTTRWVFRRGLTRPLDQKEKIAVAKVESRAQLSQLGISASKIDSVWQNLSNEYFLRYLPEEVVWHTIAMAACSPKDFPLVLLRPVSQRGSAEIFIYAEHQELIFAHSTAILDQLGLTIFDARIMTVANGYSLNSYHVLEETGEPIHDYLRQVQICAKLRQCLLQPEETPIEVHRLETRHVKHFAVSTKVYFHDDPQKRFTILELIATDRPGLLSKVGQAFREYGVRLHNARISTVGSRAEDIFYVTGLDQRPLISEAEKQQLNDRILQWVGQR